MLRKQLESWGVPAWNSEHCGGEIGKAMQVFLVTSDGGSDQKLCRKAIMLTTDSLPNVMVVEANCCFHDLHLIYKEGSVRIDKWLTRNGKTFRHFGTLAKCSHLCRDSDRSLFLCWRDAHGSESAMQYASRKFPRCVAGRWGSVSDAEIAFNNPGMKLFVVPFIACLRNPKPSEI